MRLIVTGIFTIIGLIWIAPDPTYSQKLRSNYDEPCNKTVRCKSQAWLACDPETDRCHCAKSDEMIYDPMRAKCVSLIGERCKFGFDEDEGPEAWFQRADCVPGAVCGPSGICSCPEGFYEDLINNQCAKVKENGVTCESKNECNQNKL